MEEGGVAADVEAQQGEPHPEQAPLTCADIAESACLAAVTLLSAAAGVFLVATAHDDNQAPAALIVTTVIGCLVALAGCGGAAFIVYALLTLCRASRRVRSLTRLHIVVVAPPPVVPTGAPP